MKEIGNKIGKWNPPKHTQFQKWNKIKADPEQKKEGWDRRRHAQKMMDLVRKYQDCTREDLKKLSESKDVTILELQMIRYVADWMKNDKLLTHMIDKHVSNAPQQMELTWQDWDKLDIKISLPQ